MASIDIAATRREFMFGIGAFGLVFGASGLDLAPTDKFTGKITGRKLRLASIGCGGMGRSATQSLINAGCDLVAICDIDPSQFHYWEKKYPGIPKFVDYRDMLKTMGDKFDAVQVGTPDHTHAYISIDCMNAGKHVYVQKPLARTVEECELMLATSLRTRRVVQMGNQGHPGVWRYKALRDSNAWGDIKAIYSWSDRPVWPQGMKSYPKAEKIPDVFKPQSWDCWCGPSADHGYSSAYHRFKWRGWWDYGCDAIGDMAVHNAAMAKGDKAATYNHYREFVEACLAGDLDRCGSKLAYAAPLTESLLIGCVALRYPGEKLAFDRKAMRFSSKPEANEYLKAPKRGDWDFSRLS